MSATSGGGSSASQRARVSLTIPSGLVDLDLEERLKCHQPNESEDERETNTLEPQQQVVSVVSVRTSSDSLTLPLLQPGDWLQSINGVSVTSVELAAALMQATAGAARQVEVLRGSGGGNYCGLSAFPGATEAAIAKASNTKSNAISETGGKNESEDAPSTKQQPPPKQQQRRALVSLQQNAAATEAAGSLSWSGATLAPGTNSTQGHVYVAAVASPSESFSNNNPTNALKVGDWILRIIGILVGPRVPADELWNDSQNNNNRILVARALDQMEPGAVVRQQCRATKANGSNNKQLCNKTTAYQRISRRRTRQEG